MEELIQITGEHLNRVLYGNQLYSSFSYEDYVYGNCSAYSQMIPTQDGYLSPEGASKDRIK